MRVATLLVLVCFSLACSKGEPRPPTAASSSPKSTGSPAPVIPRSGLPAAGVPAPTPAQTRTEGPGDESLSIELVSTGARPREELRRRFERGRKQQTTVRTAMTVQADVNGERGATVPTPPVVVDMQVEAEEVTPEGVATLRWVVTGARIEADAKAPGEVIERLKGAAAVMAGVSGSYTSDPRGIVREIETNIPSTTTPAIRQIITGVLRSMRRMSPPFPAEPVGVGGQWKVKHEIEQNGARVEETSTIEIAKLAPDSVSLDITIEQDAAPQDLTPTAAPPGLTLRLVGLRARGRGETRLALRDLAPESARIDTRIDMQMREEAPTGQTTETKVVMETGATQRLE